MPAMEGQHFGSGIHQDWHVTRAGDSGDVLERHRPAFGRRPRQNVDHRGARSKSRFQLLRRRNFDDLDPHIADRGIVIVAGRAWKDHLVPGEPGEIGNPLVQVGIAARDTSGGGIR